MRSTPPKRRKNMEPCARSVQDASIRKRAEFLFSGKNFPELSILPLWQKQL